MGCCLTTSCSLKMHTVWMHCYKSDMGLDKFGHSLRINSWMRQWNRFTWVWLVSLFPALRQSQSEAALSWPQTEEILLAVTFTIQAACSASMLLCSLFSHVPTHLRSSLLLCHSEPVSYFINLKFYHVFLSSFFKFLPVFHLLNQTKVAAEMYQRKCLSLTTIDSI